MMNIKLFIPIIQFKKTFEKTILGCLEKVEN
jgi:hypothetical protein